MPNGEAESQHLCNIRTEGEGAAGRWLKDRLRTGFVNL